MTADEMARDRTDRDALVAAITASYSGRVETMQPSLLPDVLSFGSKSLDAVVARVEPKALALGTQAMDELWRVIKSGGRALVILEYDTTIDEYESEQLLWRAAAGRLHPERRVRFPFCLVVEFTKRASVLFGEPPAQSSLQWGDFRRTTPFSRQFGFDRGLPVDRYYIHQFLNSHSADVRGNVLEVGDDAYTWRYGGDRVATSDVMRQSPTHPRATFINASLEEPDQIPNARFDCIICTQTLQYVYDVRKAVASLHRMLRPAGALLLTVPGVSQIGNDAWHKRWYWSLSPGAVQRLLNEVFEPDRLEVTSAGNVLAANSFLLGLASHELTVDELEVNDPSYPVVVMARAVRGACD